MRQKSIAVIVVAAGKGERATSADASRPAQCRPLGRTPLLSRTLPAFLDQPGIAMVLPVIHADHAALYEELHLSRPRLLPPVTGGDTRQASVLAGLQALAPQNPDI